MTTPSRRGLSLMLAVVVTILTFLQGVVTAPAALAADASCTGGSLYVIAHQDDDLIFQSPDLLADVSAKRCVRSLYLTAGDGGYFDDYWPMREKGIEAAYAQMAGVSNSWSTGTVSLGGKAVRLRTLNAAPSISVVFMRLPDGFPTGSGSAEQGYQSLYKLLRGDISSMTAVDGSASWSASAVRNGVLDAMRSKNVTMVRTQDYVSNYGNDGDHYDHHAAGFITLDASNNYSTPHLLRSYLGYNATTWASNVSGTNLSRKKAAFETYAQYDDDIDLDEYYNVYRWLDKQYVIASSGPSVAANAGVDQSVAAGTRVTLDGSGSSGSGTLSYAWTQTAGPSVSLSGATTAAPTFTPATVGTYTFRLTASSGGSSATDTVTVTATSTNYLNVARASGVGVTASSQASGQPATSVIDGSPLGYPDDYTREWASVGGGAGTWVQLAWSTPVRVDRVVLYDRPNTNDQVLGGTLTFSNGSTVSVGTLANSGATTVNFPARATSSLRFTVNSVSSNTENVGLAEFEVYGNVDKAPTANAGADQTVSAATQVTLNGSGTDPDGDALTYAWRQTAGTAVTLSSSTAAKPTFTPTAGGTYTFELTVSDGAMTAKDTVTITVSQTNRAPTANAGVDQSVVSGSLVTLDGSASTDPDSGTTLTYLWKQTAGTAVTLSSTTAAKPTFTASATGTYTFGLTVSDGALTSTQDTVTVTVTANRPPTANAGPDQTVQTGTQVTLSGTGADPDGRPVTYAWAPVPPTTATLAGATTAKPTFTPTAAGTYTFELTVSDGSLTAKDTVTITVTQANRAPSVNAGADQSVTTGTAVTLDGSATDADGDALTYAWSRDGGTGPAVTLAGATTLKPTFTPSATGTYTFRLTASDGKTTGSDTVTVTVTQANRTPSANAGPDQAVTTGSVVTLDGSGSTDPDPGAQLTYSWAQTAGTAVTLSSTTAVKPTFTASTTGSRTFRLTVSDGTLSSTDEVTVVVSDAPANRAPVADAGDDRTVAPGTAVTLDGTGSSDPDGTAITYAWSQSGGPSVTLSSTTASRPTFTPSQTGTYVFDLTVSDGILTSARDSVTITVTQGNRAPTANAGTDQSVTTGTLVTLAGSGSDPDGDTLTYAWTRTSGTAVTLSGASTATASFTPTTTGTWVFTLTVSDGTLSDTDTVTVTVTGANRAPTANAGTDQSVTTGTQVTLAGSGTDPDGDTLGYTWAQTAGTAVTLSSASVARPTFTPTAAGTYTFRLTVSDGALTATDNVTVTVTQAPANRAPVANAGPDQTVSVTTRVTLDGSGSTDPDTGTTLGYAWAQVGGPSVSLSGATTAKPTFTPTVAGNYTFQLTVSDGALTAQDTVTVTARAATNVARQSGVTVTQSSQSTNQQGTKAIDGVAQGWPTDYTREWATAGGGAGSWIKLTWPAPVTLDRIVLYDRPNTNDRVLGGTLQFSDGSTVPVTSLDNAGAATTFTFPSRTVTSVQLTITSVSSGTENIGLAEFEAWGTSTVQVPNRAPVASAGGDVTVAAGTALTLDGSGSNDPDGDALTYAWAKTSGPALTLPNPGVARPTFTPTTVGTYTFELTVSDGALTARDSVTVVVTARPSVNIARLPGVTVTQTSQATNQQGTKAIDGVAQGWPTDYTREWASVGGRAGTWIKLSWASPTMVDRVVLYDRPNANDQVLAGTLTFSNGSTVPVGQLANTGGATTITFSPREVTSVQLTVTSVSSATENVGLAEFEVWEAV